MGAEGPGHHQEARNNFMFEVDVLKKGLPAGTGAERQGGTSGEQPKRPLLRHWGNPWAGNYHRAVSRGTCMIPWEGAASW